MIRLKIYRKKHFSGCIVPFYVVIDYDVNKFKNLIENIKIAMESGNKTELEQLNLEFNNINIMPIKNGKSIETIINKNNCSIFVTNSNFEDTEIYPLSCSNQLIINNNEEIIIEVSKWFKKFELTLRIK